MSIASETKSALRQRLRAEALGHSPAEIAEGSRAICDRIQKQDIWRKANTVLLYCAVPGEPDLGELLEAALGVEKSVALPRYSALSGTYEVCRITRPGSQLVLGQFAIREPSAECPVVELNKLDLALVPGVGFTVNGCRLGRGKGHFDRMLAQVPGWKYGVGFDWQVVAEIPIEQHDIRLDGIVTPTRWHAIREPL
jgi:5-formyltetrahydrofolate cyclo-ligase